MAVLRRDAEAYQRALDQYQRQVGAYNRRIEAYNRSIVSDASGNYYVVGNDGTTYIADKGSGNVTATALPGGRALGDYGMSAIEGDKNFRLLRQNPAQARRDTYDDVRYQPGWSDEGGQGGNYFYRQVPAGTDYEGNPQYRTEVLGPEWRQDAVRQGAVTGWGDNESRQPDTYTFSRDASTYDTKPGAFDKKFTKTAPDPTYAQLRQLQQGTANQQALAAERGLISEVMRGGGVLADRPKYAAYGQSRTPGVGSTAESMPSVTLLPVVSKPGVSVDDAVPIVSKPGAQASTGTPLPVQQKPLALTGTLPIVSKPNA